MLVTASAWGSEDAAVEVGAAPSRPLRRRPRRRPLLTSSLLLAAAVPLALATVSPASATPTSVQVASGYACHPAHRVGGIGSGQTLATCEAGCVGNCTAFAHRAGACEWYGACPVAGHGGRVLMEGAGGNDTSTHVLVLTPTLRVSTEVGFSGDAGDLRSYTHTSAQQRPSWTISARVRVDARRSPQVVFSTESGFAGYELRVAGGRWGLRVGNGTFTHAAAGGTVRFHTWSTVVATYSAAVGHAAVEVDGRVEALVWVGLDAFAPSQTPFRLGGGGGGGGAGNNFVGRVRGLEVYEATLDSHVVAAMSAAAAAAESACPRAPAPNEGFAAASPDHGAAFNGRCLYLGGGGETCTDACYRLTQGRCVDPATAAPSASACMAAMQRLGVPYTSVGLAAAPALEGCAWTAEGQRLDWGYAGGACDSQPPAHLPNETRYRVCACEAVETATVTAAACPGLDLGDVCTPCPRLLFRGRDWVLTSGTYACAANANGTDGGLLDSTEVPNTAGLGVAACRERCEGTRGCAGVDYYAWTGRCDLNAVACTHPTLEGNGSSSHRMRAAAAYRCPQSDVTALENMGADGSVCACRAWCAGIGNGTAYGDFRSNGDCTCYASCHTAEEVTLACGADSCANLTAFFVPFPNDGGTQREGRDTFTEGCASVGVQKLGQTPFVADTVAMEAEGGSGDLGVAEFGGRAGFSFGGFFRREGRGVPAAEPNHVWRITNLNGTSLGWEVCEMGYYLDDDCTVQVVPNGTITWTVHALPLRSHTFGNASFADDGDVETCASVSCGEFATGVGCSARIASYVVVFSHAVDLRCVAVYQRNHHLHASPGLAVEKLSPGRTWEEQWTCLYNVRGRWQQCSRGTGLVYVAHRTTWAYAREGCESRGGDLVAIQSQGANNAVMKLLGEHAGNTTDGAWIGAFRPSDAHPNETLGGYISAADNTFRWVDGTDWEWLTATQTLTFTRRDYKQRPIWDEHVPGLNERDFAHWQCGWGHPPRGTGDCGYVVGELGEAGNCGAGKAGAVFGEWAPMPCELSRAGYVCNITDPQRRDAAANDTYTQTLSETQDPVTEESLPVSLFHCSNGRSDDEVSLVFDRNTSVLTYTVSHSAPSNFPAAKAASSEVFFFSADPVPLDSRYHHVAVAHMASGVVRVSVDFEALVGGGGGGGGAATAAAEALPRAPWTVYDNTSLAPPPLASWLTASAVNASANGTGEVAALHDYAGDAPGVSARGGWPAPVWVEASTPGGRWPSLLFGSQNLTESSMVFERPLYSDSGAVTVVAVVKPTGAAGTPYLVNAGDTWGLTVGVDKVVCFASGDHGRTRATATSFAPWDPPGEDGWLLVACTIEATQAITLRVNAYQRATQDIPSIGTLNTTGAANETRPTHVLGGAAGYTAFFGSGRDGAHFTGYLAELAVFSQLLSADTLSALEAALALKHFGGRLARPPPRAPRGECAVGAASSVAAFSGGVPVRGFEGSVRDALLHDAGATAQEAAALALPHGRVLALRVGSSGGDEAQPGAAQRLAGALVRGLGCTSPDLCAGPRGARTPVPGAGFAPALPTHSAVFEGHVTVAALPSGDQPIFSYGGSGCAEAGGALRAWAYPVAHGYSLALGEWDGAAARGSETLRLGQRYAVRFEVDFDTGAAGRTAYEGDAMLSGMVRGGGGAPWKRGSRAQCGAAPCVVAGQPARGFAARLSTPGTLVAAASSSVWVAAFGSPGGGGKAPQLAGRAAADGTGFTGIALYDLGWRRYVASEALPSVPGEGANATGLGWGPWEMRRFAGRRLRIDLLDARCGLQGEGCEAGWAGFGALVLKNFNARRAAARISVQGTVVADDVLHLQKSPFEAGDFSLLARCHNDTTSGSLKGVVSLTGGCPFYHNRHPPASGGDSTAAAYHSTNPHLARQNSSGEGMQETPTVSVTDTLTTPGDCNHFFSDAADDYNIGRPGNMGEATFGYTGGVSISFWVRIFQRQVRDAVVVDFANEPRDHRVYVSFHGDTGSMVYRVEEDSGYEVKWNTQGIGNPEVGQLPTDTGAEGTANLNVEEEFTTYVGCFSNYTAFGAGGGGRLWRATGGSLNALMHDAVAGQWEYIALANTPLASAGKRFDGGAFYFNTLAEAGDLARSDCAAVPCDAGQGVCGCAGGGACGTYAVQSGRCPALDSPVTPCALTTQSWAVYRRVYPRGPQIPADGRWHHVGIIHRHDRPELRHKTLAMGTAFLYVDHVLTHHAVMILPQKATRVNNLVGRSNNGNYSLTGMVKDVYLV